MFAPALIVFAFVLPGFRAEPETPLATAARDGRTAEVRRLIAAGVEVDAPAGGGFTALGWASRFGHLEAMHALVEGGAALDSQDQGVNGWTPIMHALHKDRTKAALALLEWGADVNATSRNGTTPLMRAATENEPEVVQALLARGADPRRETCGGSNALAFAVSGGNVDIVRMLLRAAPDLRLDNSFERHLVRIVARLRGHSAALDAIREAGTPPVEPKAEPQG